MIRRFLFFLLLMSSAISTTDASWLQDFLSKHKNDATDPGHILNKLAGGKTGYALPVLAGLQVVDAGLRMRRDLKAISVLLNQRDTVFAQHNAQQTSTFGTVRRLTTDVVEAALPVASVVMGKEDTRVDGEFFEYQCNYNTSSLGQEINPNYRPAPAYHLCKLGFGSMYVVLAAQALDVLHRVVSGKVVLSKDDQEALKAYVAQLSESDREKISKQQQHLRHAVRVTALLRTLQAAGTAAIFGVGQSKKLDGGLFVVMAIAGAFGLLHKGTSMYSRWRINRALRDMLKKAHNYAKKIASHSA